MSAIIIHHEGEPVHSAQFVFWMYGLPIIISSRRRVDLVQEHVNAGCQVFPQDHVNALK